MHHLYLVEDHQPQVHVRIIYPDSQKRRRPWSPAQRPPPRRWPPSSGFGEARPTRILRKRRGNGFKQQNTVYKYVRSCQVAIIEQKTAYARKSGTHVSRPFAAGQLKSKCQFQNKVCKTINRKKELAYKLCKEFGCDRQKKPAPRRFLVCIGCEHLRTKAETSRVVRVLGKSRRHLKGFSEYESRFFHSVLHCMCV